MDLDDYFAHHPMGGTMDVQPGFKSGFVTLIGRPNSGKSTLMNKIMGMKIAITSSTSQTTRHRINAILTRPDFQMIMVDTPGLHKPHDALGDQLNAQAVAALDGVDVVAMLIDSSQSIGRGDEWVAAQVKACTAKKICVLSKVDLVDKKQLDLQCLAAQTLVPWDAMVGLSAKSGYHVDAFIEEAVGFLPEGPLWFPADMETDQPLEVMVAEFIREKVLRSFQDEVPHATGVAVDLMEYVSKKDLYRIYASIYVERDSQKAILIGKGGHAIKSLGIAARKDLEHLLGTRVFLDVSVKVKHHWRCDQNQLRRFGYME